MSQQNIAKPPSRALVTGTVTFYLVAALAMVMANKWVLNETKVPLFFLFTQLLIAVVLFLISHIVGFLKVPVRVDWQLYKGLAPMVALNVVGLSFNNYTLINVDASFYQVARGLVLPLTVTTSYMFLHARPSLNILISCGVVTLGFLVGVFLDGNYPSPLGIAFGIASSGTTALHAVIIKRALDLLNGSALDLAWYSNLLSAIVLLPLLLIAGEGPAVLSLLTDGIVFGTTAFTTFLWGSAITGVFGFLMCIASLMSIKVTSPITHMISSAVRGVAASFLGVWLFGDIITGGRASSIAIILAGSIYYTWVKHIESQKPQPKASESMRGAYSNVPLEDLEAGKETKPE